MVELRLDGVAIDVVTVINLPYRESKDVIRTC